MKTKYFVFLYKPGTNWLLGKPPLEQPLGGHFKYMSELAGLKKLVVGGGFLDGAGAMGILQVETLEEAETLVAKDPAVADNIVVASVHPYLVTVAGNIQASNSG